MQSSRTQATYRLRGGGIGERGEALADIGACPLQFRFRRWGCDERGERGAVGIGRGDGRLAAGGEHIGSHGGVSLGLAGRNDAFCDVGESSRVRGLGSRAGHARS